MQSKRKVKKISHIMLGYSGVALVISQFFFSFINLTCYALLSQYLQANPVEISDSLRQGIDSTIQYFCFFSSLFVFFCLFLLLTRRRTRYLREIIGGIEALRLRNMEYMVSEQGNDELTELAASINYLSQTRRALMEREQQLAEDKRQLLKALSHDIRTPLTSMLSYTELLSQKEDLSKEEMQDYIALMFRKGKQMKTLSDRLLENSNRKLELILEGRLLMMQLCEEWVEMLESSFRCNVDLESCPKFEATFDVEDLRRIFDNLASNVEKYADPSQSVELRIFEKDNTLILQQKNYISPHPNKEESHRIGLQSIGQIVALYGGNYEVHKESDVFCIEIAFQHVRFVKD